MNNREGLREFAANILSNFIKLFNTTFKVILFEKVVPFHMDAAFCQGVLCYVSSKLEIKRSSRVFPPEILQWLSSFEKGDVFCDIGSNIGMFALTAAKLHDNKIEIYAFEPSFSTFTTLVMNIVINGFGEIIFPFSVPLSSEKRVRRFNYAELSAGAAIHSLDHVNSKQGESITSVFSQKVISYSLDKLIEDFGLRIPNHIKIDVDGAEEDVVQGMKRVIENPILKSVLVEITENTAIDEKARYVESKFIESGFHVVSKIRHGKKSAFPVISDVLFVRNWSVK
ncbi:hypothetical protein MASR2M66_18740 [Chloroflexota bacterium]